MLLPCHKMAHFFSFNEAIWGKYWEEDVELLDLAFLNNSSKCLVLVPHRQLGNYLLIIGESYGPTPQHIHKTGDNPQ